MADKVIDSNRIVLLNRWGVAPIRVDDGPLDGFTGASHFNVATNKFPLGTCIQVRHKGTLGVAGYSEFTYLQAGTPHATVALAVKLICTQDSAAAPLIVTNDKGSAIGLATIGLCAVALGAVTVGNYGFFWTGGVCPEDEVSGLGGDYPTDDSVAAGSIKIVALTADAIGFGAAYTAISGTAAVTNRALECGYSLLADS